MITFIEREICLLNFSASGERISIGYKLLLAVCCPPLNMISHVHPCRDGRSWHGGQRFRYFRPTELGLQIFHAQFNGCMNYWWNIFPCLSSVFISFFRSLLIFGPHQLRCYGLRFGSRISVPVFGCVHRYSLSFWWVGCPADWHKKFGGGKGMDILWFRF